MKKQFSKVLRKLEVLPTDVNEHHKDYNNCFSGGVKYAIHTIKIEIAKKKRKQGGK